MYSSCSINIQDWFANIVFCGDLTTCTKQAICVLSNDCTNLSDDGLHKQLYSFSISYSVCSLYAWLCTTDFSVRV